MYRRLFFFEGTRAERRLSIRPSGGLAAAHQAHQIWRCRRTAVSLHGARLFRTRDVWSLLVLPAQFIRDELYHTVRAHPAGGGRHCRGHSGGYFYGSWPLGFNYREGGGPLLLLTFPVVVVAVGMVRSVLTRFLRHKYLMLRSLFFQLVVDLLMVTSSRLI